MLFDWYITERIFAKVAGENFSMGRAMAALLLGYHKTSTRVRQNWAASPWLVPAAADRVDAARTAQMPE